MQGYGHSLFFGQCLLGAGVDEIKGALGCAQFVRVEVGYFKPATGIPGGCLGEAV